jgi:cation diffusion facilitator CzcD-associated flavoprotein CzcO
MCSGYYSYRHGHEPELPGRDRFGGLVVHPQSWPEDLDYTNRRVVVIGSGATAVTLVPAMAERAAHVTMLQRSPTYMVSRPDEDAVANALRALLPDRLAYALTRWKNVRLQQWVYRQTRTRPERVKKKLLDWVRKELPASFDVEKHLTPRYDPWDQRLCLVPNGDLFEALRSGKASVATDVIETFTERGIRLRSGEELTADIVVTATGLELVVLGEVDFEVDGEPVDFSKTWTYKGLMYSDVPNLMSTFGYINASWTLRADLVAEYLCRLLRHMDATDTIQCTPRLRESDAGMRARPWIEGFSPGYLKRKLHLLPKQGDRAPWINPQVYAGDKVLFRAAPIDDGCLVFERRTRAASASFVDRPARSAAG